MTISTAAVVVTFNRKALLLECIAGLLNQTHPIDRIFLIDNASTDGTEALLAEKGYLDHQRITYRRLDTNTGGAGGFYEGMRQAYDEGYDWIWVMDDDAEPVPDALAQLAKHYGEGHAALCGRAVFTTGAIANNHRGNIRKSFLSGSLVKPLWDIPADQKPSIITFCSFVGLAVSAKAIAKIGLPLKDFFIHRDDNEYCMRIAELGGILMEPASAIVHKEKAKPVPIRNEAMRWLGSVHADYDRLWIEYFGWRNRMWLIMKKHPLRGRLYAALALLYLDLGIVLFDDHKARRLRFWGNCFLDALTGNFDNAKPRKILQGS